MSSFEPPSQGGVQVDDLDNGKSRERLEHHKRRLGLERLLAALHELNGLAVHQINTRNDHSWLDSSPGFAAPRCNKNESPQARPTPSPLARPD